MSCHICTSRLSFVFSVYPPLRTLPTRFSSCKALIMEASLLHRTQAASCQKQAASILLVSLTALLWTRVAYALQPARDLVSSVGMSRIM